MITTLIIIFLLIFIISIFILNKQEDTFAGAMTQMYAKGPEDNYLTDGTERRFIPPYNMFYNPTRWIPEYPYYPNYYPYYYPRRWFWQY